MKNLFFTLLALCAFSLTSLTAQKTSLKAGNDALYQKALEASCNAERDAAVSLFDQVLKQNPAHFMAAAQKALLEFHWENKDAFHKNAAKALSIPTRNEYEKAVLEILKMRLENMDADVTGLAKQLATNNAQLAEAHLINAMIHMEAKDPAIAMEALYNVKRLTPDFAPVYNMLGYAHLELNQMEQAGKMFEKYLSLLPNHANPYDSMGDYLMEKGDFAKAAEMYEKAAATNKSFDFSKEKAEKARQKAGQ